MQFLVLQHDPRTHLAAFAPMISGAGHDVHVVHLDQGEALPDLEGVDALWVLGGPQNVFEEDQYPWLIAEKALIRDAVETRALPYFGICLGHQLLAEALGGACALGGREIGVVEVTPAPEAALFDGMPSPFPVAQWHGVEVTAAPPGAQVTAWSPGCAIQALRMGETAFSVQSHPEVLPGTISDWGEIPEAAAILDDALGAGGTARFESAVNQHAEIFAANARILFTNWCRAAGIPTEPLT
ncbi:MAG: type 1 glutamine amidotransferase [Pseudomonadota bacterium]